MHKNFEMFFVLSAIEGPSEHLHRVVYEAQREHESAERGEGPRANTHKAIEQLDHC